METRLEIVSSQPAKVSIKPDAGHTGEPTAKPDAASEIDASAGDAGVTAIGPSSCPPATPPFIPARYELITGSGLCIYPNEPVGSDIMFLALATAPCSGNRDQQWDLSRAPGDTFAIRNVAIDNYMDVRGKSQAEGAYVGTFHFQNDTNQWFTFEELTLPDVAIRPAHGDGICIEETDNHTITITTCDSEDPAQHWTLIPAENRCD